MTETEPWDDDRWDRLESWDEPEPGRGRQRDRLYRPIALVDLLDRVLGGGVVVAGEVTLAIDGVDVTRISLRAVVASVSALMETDA